MDSGGLLLIIEVKINFSIGFDDTDNQTNKLNELNCKLSFGFSISLTTEDCESNYD